MLIVAIVSHDSGKCCIIPGVTAENQAALGTTTSAADSALSKEAQEADQKTLEEGSEMVKSAETIAQWR